MDSFREAEMEMKKAVKEKNVKQMAQTHPKPLEIQGFEWINYKNIWQILEATASKKVTKKM